MSSKSGISQSYAKLQHTTQRVRSRLLFMHAQLGRYTLVAKITAAACVLLLYIQDRKWAVACLLYVEGCIHHSELTFLGDTRSLGIAYLSSRLGPMSTPELHGLVGADVGF
jgi:hypothetical protein